MASLLQSCVASLDSFLERRLGPPRTSEGDRRVLTLDDLRIVNQEGPRRMARVRSVTDDLVLRGGTPLRARSRALSADDGAMWRRSKSASCCSTDHFRHCMEESWSGSSSPSWSACDRRVLESEGPLSFLSRVAVASIEVPKQFLKRWHATAMGRFRDAQNSLAGRARSVCSVADALRARHFHAITVLQPTLPTLTTDMKVWVHELSRRSFALAFALPASVLGARRCLALLKAARERCPMTLVKVAIEKLENTAAAHVNAEKLAGNDQACSSIDGGTGGLHADEQQLPPSRQPSVASGDTGSVEGRA